MISAAVFVRNNPLTSIFTALLDDREGSAASNQNQYQYALYLREIDLLWCGVLCCVLSCFVSKDSCYVIMLLNY
jgi:hypothetical protein